MGAPNEGSAPNIGLASLPNQRHKIVSMKGATLTVMLAGKSRMGVLAGF